MVQLNINTSALVGLTNKLEKLSRSALPVAIRGTLNKAAFNLKQKTMPMSAEKHFEKRSPNFFKANSKVQMATGFSVNAMKAYTGFISSNLKYNNFSVTELEDQEYGGKIPKRSFIPLDTARRDDSYASPVRPANRLKNITSIVDVADAKGRTAKEQFIKSAIYAKKGGFVKAGIGGAILYRINSIQTKGGKTIIKKTPVYSYRKGRSVGVKGTGFMKEASLQSASRLDEFYKEEAERQFAKVFK